ncbi:MAG TPA: S26 family signal peptidase [Mycobacteriales bacterium]|nr:S26 family signal peptidase [Mycobacteriales bacterium]
MARRWGRVVVSGVSMLPVLAPGDHLLVQWGRQPRPGRIVVVRRGGRLDVKRAIRVTDEAWWVEGDNGAASTDSREYGAVPVDDILGVVHLRYRPWQHRTRLR